MNKEIYEWAIKGITAEIQDLEKTVKKGYKYIEQIERGEKVKTPKTPQEIKAIITEKQAEIERLEKLKFTLKWEQ